MWLTTLSSYIAREHGLAAHFLVLGPIDQAASQVAMGALVIVRNVLPGTDPLLTLAAS